MNVRQKRNAALGQRVVKALKSRNMDAYYVETKEEAKNVALKLITLGSTITLGGTMSIKECGIYDSLDNEKYNLLDKDKVDSTEEKNEVMLKAFTADWYLGSVNAMSEDGIFVDIDATGNRVASYAFGPKNVLLVVGMNKIEKNLENAVSRARNEAAPINAQRFGIETPCIKNGSCFNCKSKECICCQIMITRFSKIPGRIKIILVDDYLGF